MRDMQNDVFYLKEAFKKLSTLNEDSFDLTSDVGVIDELQSFVADDIDAPYEEEIIDIDADNNEELLDSYVGKCILQCNCCNTKIYKDIKDIIIDEETETANVEEECPKCGNAFGWTVIGKIEPFDENEFEDQVDDQQPTVELELTDDEISETLKEALNESKGENKPYVVTYLGDEIASFDYPAEAREYQQKKTFSGTYAKYGYEWMSREEFENSVNSMEEACKDETLKEDDNVKIPKIPKWWRITDTLGHPFRFENGNYFYTVKDVKNYFPEAVKIKVIEYFSDEEIKEKPWLVKQFYNHLNEDIDIHVGETPEGELKVEVEADDQDIIEIEKENIDDVVVDESCRDDSLKEDENKKREPDVVINNKRELKDWLSLNKRLFINVEFVKGQKDKFPKIFKFIKEDDNHFHDWYREIPQEEFYKYNFDYQTNLFDESLKDDVNNKQHNDLDEDYLHSLPKEKEQLVNIINKGGENKDREIETYLTNISLRTYEGKEDAEEWANYINKLANGKLKTSVGGSLRDNVWFVKSTGAHDGEQATWYDLSLDEDNLNILIDELGLKTRDKNADESFKESYDYAYDYAKYSWDHPEVDIEKMLKDDGKDEKFINDVFNLLDEFAAEDELERVDESIDHEDVSINPETSVEHDQKLEDPEENPVIDERNEVDLKESIDNLSLDTDTTHMEMTSDDNGKVTIVTEPRENTDEVIETGKEMIAPLTDEEQTEIMNNEEDVVTDDGSEFEIDEFDEESFDELGESFLKRVYENVNSFKTVEAKYDNNKLYVEGLIKFNSGKEKKTTFKFENFKKSKKGKLVISGLNETFAKNKKAFSLKGSLVNKHFVSESLVYKYNTKNINEGNKNEVVNVFGKVVIKK